MDPGHGSLGPHGGWSLFVHVARGRLVEGVLDDVVVERRDQGPRLPTACDDRAVLCHG